MCMPGDNVEMTIELIHPVAMEQGLNFAIREGGRTVIKHLTEHFNTCYNCLVTLFLNTKDFKFIIKMKCTSLYTAYSLTSVIWLMTRNLLS